MNELCEDQGCYDHTGMTLTKVNSCSVDRVRLYAVSAFKEKTIPW